MPTNKPQTYTRNLNTPDERRDFKAHGHLDIVNFGDEMSIGKAVFEPGWRWSNDVQPIAGTSTCQSAHTGYCISGSMRIRMDNGDEFVLRAGDAFHFPPGHDAWVEGSEACTLIDVEGYKNYAVKAA
jgi:quercetin dioxygenase-like cupin family protein